MSLSNASISAALTVADTVANGMASATLSGGLSIANLVLTAGTASGQADRYFLKNDVPLAAGASVTYTLSALTDDLNRNQSMARVRAWGVDGRANPEANALRVASGATNGWTAPFDGAAGKIIVKGGGFFVEAAPGTTGLPATAGASDQLTITNTGGSAATFDLAIVGASV